MSNRRLAVLTMLLLLPGGWALAQQASPLSKDVCVEAYAQASASQAYLEAKLALAEKQRPAWNKWHQWMIDAALNERTDCLDGIPALGGVATALDRETQTERNLSIRLQGLQAARQSLEALYAVLTPDQRMILNQPRNRGGRRDDR